MKVSYTTLSKIIIPRQIIKKAVMTIPYNASPRSIVDYLNLIKSEYLIRILIINTLKDTIYFIGITRKNLL